MRDEPNPRQQALDGLTGERFGQLPTTPPISEPVNVGTGPSAMLVAQAREANRQRRARVLAHPDIAQRLTQSPLNFTTPQQWTGYVPPEQHGGVRNDSHRRAALVAIMRDVGAAELAEAAAAARHDSDDGPSSAPAPDPEFGYDPPEPDEGDAQ